MREFVLKQRDSYVVPLWESRDNGMVKIITGIRGGGKTCILRLLQARLESIIMEEDRVIRINFDSIDVPQMIDTDLYAFLRASASKEGKNYIMLDELQQVDGWEQVVSDIQKEFDCDFYLASSHRGILSSSLPEIQEGHYELHRVLPLSLAEFIDYHQFSLMNETAPLEEQKFHGRNGKIYNLAEIYNLYIKYGGLPLLASMGLDGEKFHTIVEGTFSTVIVRDILEFEKRKSKRLITDPLLLRDTMTIMADSIGKNISATGVVKELGEHRGSSGQARKHGTRTVETYMEALQVSYFFYESKRYDIKADKYLKTLSKNYVVDAGFHNYLLGIRDADAKALFENKVFFELMRRGYDICNGKLGNHEVHFVATKGQEKIYVQAAMDLTESNAKEVLNPLRKIRDSYPKVVIAFYEPSGRTNDGIIIKNALELMMGGSIL